MPSDTSSAPPTWTVGTWLALAPAATLGSAFATLAYVQFSNTSTGSDLPCRFISIGAAGAAKLLQRAYMTSHPDALTDLTAQRSEVRALALGVSVLAPACVSAALAMSSVFGQYDLLIPAFTGLAEIVQAQHRAAALDTRFAGLQFTL